MLAAVALIRGRSAQRVAIALFGALWLAVVVGVPPFLQIVTRLPLFSSGHNSRLIIFTILALALLAGWGLDELASRWREHRQRSVALGTAAALVVVPAIVLVVISPNVMGVAAKGIGVAWLFQDPPGSVRDLQGLEVLRAASLATWLTFAGLSFVLVAARLAGRVAAGPAFVILAAVLVCTDLFRVGVGYNPAIDRSLADPPRTGAIRFLERQRQVRFVGIEEVPQNVLPFRWGLHESRGYDLPLIRRYDRLWREEISPQARSVAAGFIDIPLRVPEITPRVLRTLRLLGTTHVLGPNVVWPPVPPLNRVVVQPPLKSKDLSLVYNGPDARVYRVEEAAPRAWVAGAQMVTGGEDEARRALRRPDSTPVASPSPSAVWPAFRRSRLAILVSRRRATRGSLLRG